MLLDPFALRASAIACSKSATLSAPGSRNFPMIKDGVPRKPNASAWSLLRLRMASISPAWPDRSRFNRSMSTPARRRQPGATEPRTTKAPPRIATAPYDPRALCALFGRNPDPVLVRTIPQRVEIGLGDVPIDDGAIAGCDIAVGDRRRLHGVIEIDAAAEQQRAQNHPEKRLHGEPPVSAITRITSASSRLRSSEAHREGDSGPEKSSCRGLWQVD